MKRFNIHFFILFFIAITVFISDIFIWMYKTNLILTNIGVGIGILIISILLYKKNKIKIESDFSKFDLIFLIPFIIYIVFSIVFPDLSWDTRSYHIYLQENCFLDKINIDFFAGRNLNSFLFALGDRIHFLFRTCLGYRLGTIMSYYLILILFYQVKLFLKNIIKNKKDSFISFFSIFPVISSIIFSYTGTYYIDNFSLIFLMEIFLIILIEENILTNKIKIYFLSILTGIAISIKITNAIFLILLGIYFILKNYKDLRNIKIYDYIALIFCFIIPWGIYAIDNYIQTGNPVFPYYNNIFKSELFMENSWKDTNFGPENIIQFLIWPVYIVFNPSRAFDTKFVDFTWAIGFISVISYIIYSIKNKKIINNKLFVLSLIIFINYYLWEKFLIGYVRYATILLVLSLIVTIVIIDKIFNKYSKIGIICFIMFIISTLPSIGYDLLVKIKDYSSIKDIFSEYKSNFNLIIKDKYTDKISVTGVFGAIGDDSLLPSLLKENNPIYNLEEWVTITNDKTQKMYEEKIGEEIIYVPVDELTKNRKEDYLNRNSFDILQITEMEGEYNFLSPSNKLYLYKVKKKM